MKLCIIYNFAAHYRAPVFCEIDRAFDCDWYFGKTNDDIKKMDYELLKGTVTEVESRHLGSVLWYQGLLKLLRGKKYDVYLALSDTKDLSIWFFGIIAKLFYPLKRVYFWSHGWYGKENWLESRIKKLLYSLPRGGVFVYGNRARNLMIQEGLKPDKIYVIYNSLNYDVQLSLREQLSPKPIYTDHFHNDWYNIVFIGRLTKVKRFDLLLDAIAILRDRKVFVNVTFIGDGVERSNMEKIVEEKGLKSHVWFYGACYDEKTNAELIYNADICVSPGNIGLTAMHVLMFGCPAITNNDLSHQMPEFEAIKTGVTGDFFEDGNAVALAECVSNWFETQGNDRERVRQACYDEIDSKWNPHNQLRILEKVIGG